MALKDPLELLESIALGFPEAANQPFGGHTAPSFRVKGKIFVMVQEDLQTFTCKAPSGVQEMLVASEPERFFVPKYVGKNGWIGVRLIDVDRDELAAIVEDSYRMTAPKKLITRLDAN